MKRKRKTIKTKNRNVKVIKLDKNIDPPEDDYKLVNELSLNAEQSSEIVNSLDAIEHRLQASENVWKLFLHKLLEIRTNLESQGPLHQNNGPIKYEVKYEVPPLANSSDSENICEETDFPNFPITNVADFKYTNQICCSNVGCEKKLQEHFLKLSSEHLTLLKWCETNLSLFLTDFVANHFSWNGSKLTPITKQPVYRAKSIKILIDCAKIKYEMSPKSDIEQCIRWWFARTSHRTAIENSKALI